MIREHYSYELPEVLAAGVEGGSVECLEWVRSSMDVS